MELAQVVHTAVAAAADRIAATGTGHHTDTTADHLYRSIASRLHTTVIGTHLLRELENQPTAPPARRDTTRAVTAEAEADPQFAAELHHLVDQLTRDLPPAYRPHHEPPPHRQPNAVVILLIAAVAAVLLTINGIILVNLVLPHAGLTESARLNKLAGTWTSGEPPHDDRITIRRNGTFAITDPNWSCPGRVTSPARSRYVLEMDCGIFRTSFDGKLNLLGDKLTLTAPGSPETTVLTRE